MKKMTLLQAMSILQQYMEKTAEDGSDVKAAWDYVRNKMTQVLGTMLTMRQVFEADSTAEEVAGELNTGYPEPACTQHK